MTAERTSASRPDQAGKPDPADNNPDLSGSGQDGAPLPATAEPQAYARALSWLARREHSRRELTDKLAAREVAESDIRPIIERLVATGYQSDERFAHMLVRSRVGQGHGPVRIRAELRMHQIEDTLIGQAMDEEGVDWAALALDLCRRRYRTPPANHAERVKRANFLARRGFPASIARAAVEGDSSED